MASGQSIPLEDGTRPTTSKPEKSSGKKHSADKMPSELKSSELELTWDSISRKKEMPARKISNWLSKVFLGKKEAKCSTELQSFRTIEEALTSLEEEVRGLHKKIEEFLFRRLFTEGHYRSFRQTALGAKGKYTTKYVDETRAMFSKPKKSSAKKHSADNLPFELKSSTTIEEAWTSLLEEVKVLQKKIEGSLFAEKHDKGRIDTGAKGKFAKGSIEETQAMFSDPKKHSGKKHYADKLPSEPNSSRSIEDAWTSLLEEVSGFQKGIQEYQLKSKYTEEFIEKFERTIVSAQWILDNFPPELESSVYIDSLLASLQKEVTGLQTIVENRLKSILTEKHDKGKYTRESMNEAPHYSVLTDKNDKGKYTRESMDEAPHYSFLTKNYDKGKYTREPMDEAPHYSVLTEKHDKGKYTRESMDEAAHYCENHIVDMTPKKDLENDSEEINKLVEESIEEFQSDFERSNEPGWLEIWLSEFETPYYSESHIVEMTPKLDLENDSVEMNEVPEKLQSDIERRLENLPLRGQEIIYHLRSSCSEPVDEAARVAEEEAKCSNPQAASVGPHHYGDRHIVEMTQKIVATETSSEEINELLEEYVEELQSDLEKSLEMLPLREQHTIYRLPNSCSEEPYCTPRAVSIGPYHHGKTHLVIMEDLKVQFLEDFLFRNPRRSLNLFFHELERIEPQTRKYYSLKLDLSSANFVKLMLLDGCFILEFLIKFYYRTLNKNFDNCFLSQNIKTDLLMFANQIPFMVLLKLHELVNTGSLPCIYQLLVSYFWDTSNGWPTLRSSGCHNILHFYHLQFIPPFVDSHLIEKSSKNYHAKLNEKFVTQVPSAEQLEKAGVIFRGKRTINFLEITFQDGVLEIPTLSLDDPFLLLLVNLAMYEKLNIAVGKVVQTYCSFMHCLLKNPYDVRLLRISGVIEGNSISVEELRDQLDRFQNPDYLNTEKHYFVDLFFDLWEYCEKAEKNANVQEGMVKCFSFFGKAFVVVVVALLYHIWIQYYL